MKADKIERLKTFCEESTLFLKGWRDRVGFAIYEQEEVIKDRFPEHDEKIISDGQDIIMYIQRLMTEISRFDKRLEERTEMVREQQVKECNEETASHYKTASQLSV
jgi:hypothetical protein